MVNWIPKTQGPMRLRPGGKFLGSSLNDTGAAFVEFIASTTETALLELTDSKLRVWNGADDTLVTRASLATTSLGGLVISATSDTGVWTTHKVSNNPQGVGGGTVRFGDTGMVLNAQSIGGTARATGKIKLTNISDLDQELGLAIHVSRGPVTFRAGNDTGDDSYINETELRTGYHSLALIPTDTGGIHLTLETNEAVDRKIATMDLESAGTVEVTTPWGHSNLDDIRYDQSADVLFAAAYGKKQMRIERRANGRSWSVVDYTPIDGPFLTKPSTKAKLTPSATFGNITVAADKKFFKSTHVGSLFRMQHDGQGGVYTFDALNSFSDVWKVTGINDTGAGSGTSKEREVTLVFTDTGTFNGRVLLQRSFEGPDKGFQTKNTYTAATKVRVRDRDDNITVYYRLAMLGDTGALVTGALKAHVLYTNGAKDGVARINEYTSPTSVKAEVLSRFATLDSGGGQVTPLTTDDWAEGRWSGAQSFPSSVTLHDGRLWWFGGGRLNGSVADEFNNFNAATEGDAGPIDRTLATGPVDRIHFAVSLLRLFLGTAGSEISLRSTSLDEPLTPTNMTSKVTSTQGSSNLRALEIDDRALFIQRSQKRLMMLAFDATANDYLTQELTLLVPDLLSGISSIAVQRQPDTRVHCVMDDGTVAILTYQEQEEVLCWSIYKSTAADGLVQKVSVLPGTAEDQVYYHVKRTINGATKRYLERQATEAESDGDTGANFLADCAIEVAIADNGTASGLGHL